LGKPPVPLRIGQTVSAAMTREVGPTEVPKKNAAAQP